MTTLHHGKAARRDVLPPHRLLAKPHELRKSDRQGRQIRRRLTVLDPTTPNMCRPAYLWQPTGVRLWGWTDRDWLN
jgi:hypothetical protein